MDVLAALAPKLATRESTKWLGLNPGPTASFISLSYPKETDKPPFQTLEQIQRRVEGHELTESQKCELWASLFLTAEEINDMLGDVKQNADHGFIYPVFVFAAHTGARRSEKIRSELDDTDFA